MSEEIILWASFEFKYIELDDAFSTGSHDMPAEKNPGYHRVNIEEKQEGIW